MSARRIAEIENPDNGMRAVVSYDSDFQEYQARFYRAGQELAESRYFTDDKADALGTARASIGLAATYEYDICGGDFVFAQGRFAVSMRTRFNRDTGRPAFADKEELRLFSTEKQPNFATARHLLEEASRPGDAFALAVPFQNGTAESWLVLAHCEGRAAQ